MSDLEATVENVRRAFANFGGTTCAEVGIVIRDQIGPAAAAAWDACMERYRAAGAPYGDTEDSARRWYREMRDL